MKIHLKGVLTTKRLIFFSAPAAIIIGAVLIYLLAFRHPAETKSIIAPPAAKPRQVEAKQTKKSTNKKVTVITPINVVDDAFKGYELNKESDAEPSNGDDKKARQDKGAAREPREEMTVPAPQPEKAEKQIQTEIKQEITKGKETQPKDPPRGAPATSPATPAGKADASGSRSSAEDEGIKMLNERMAEVGLSEPEKKKLIQSYLELRKVLPEKEAQKMIMWKIAHEKK